MCYAGAVFTVVLIGMGYYSGKGNTKSDARSVCVGVQQRKRLSCTGADQYVYDCDLTGVAVPLSVFAGYLVEYAKRELWQ